VRKEEQVKAATKFPSLQAASDHSLLVTFGAGIDISLNERVHRLFLSLDRELPRGVVQLHPAYASLLVDFNPLETTYADLEAEIILRLPESEEEAPFPACQFEVPVCYGLGFGPDLGAVSAHCGFTVEQVIERHFATEYRVYFIGFSPGFPYLGGMDPALATPRLESPRKSVPAGSVAIGGNQTGIYPLSSPGGWRVIGRTPLRLFDPRRQPPALFQMGDRVRFRPVTPRRFAELEGRG